MMERSNSAIEFQNVTMAYDERVVLDDVSFIVNPGETKIVMGGSGTGKSTILKLVLGLIKPVSGQVLVDGENVTEYSEREITPASTSFCMRAKLTLAKSRCASRASI